VLRRTFGYKREKGILGKWIGICGLDASGSVLEPEADSCEHGNGPSVSKRDNFLKKESLS
jgi:hypothetical protein